jgi:hypothetical protein
MSVLVFPHLVMIFIGKTVVGQTLTKRFSNSLTSIFWQESRTKVSKLYKCFKNDNFEICVPERSRLLLYIADW